MIPKAEQIKNCDRMGNLPTAWIMSADCLQTAAIILKAHRDQFDPTRLNVGDEMPDAGKVLFPELMLKGFAVECLLKSLYLKRGNKLAVAGKYVGVKGAADHNLLQLADTAQLPLQSKERDILRRLSIIMTSAGRYPISRRWLARKIQRLSGGGKGLPEYWQYPADDQILEAVVAILKQELDK